MPPSLRRVLVIGCGGAGKSTFASRLGERTGLPVIHLDALFWRSRTMSNNYAARQGGWKFVHSTEGGMKPGPGQTPGRDMLFHLAEDLSEQHDLAATQPEKLAALKRLYAAWSAEVDADCRKLGLEPKMPGPEVPAAKAKDAGQ